MSETEHKVGTLVDTGELFMHYLTRKGIDDEDEYEYLHDVCQAILYEGTVWEIVNENNVDTEADIFSATRVEDSIVYEVKYYNGGCGNIEAINTALENVTGG